MLTLRQRGKLPQRHVLEGALRARAHVRPRDFLQQPGPQLRVRLFAVSQGLCEQRKLLGQLASTGGRRREAKGKL